MHSRYFQDYNLLPRCKVHVQIFCLEISENLALDHITTTVYYMYIYAKEKLINWLSVLASTGVAFQRF